MGRGGRHTNFLSTRSPLRREAAAYLARVSATCRQREPPSSSCPARQLWGGGGGKGEGEGEGEREGKGAGRRRAQAAAPRSGRLAPPSRPPAKRHRAPNPLTSGHWGSPAPPRRSCRPPSRAGDGTLPAGVGKGGGKRCRWRMRSGRPARFRGRSVRREVGHRRLSRDSTLAFSPTHPPLPARLYSGG